MPRSTRSSSLSDRKKQNKDKKLSDAECTQLTSVTNVNSNHSARKQKIETKIQLESLKGKKVLNKAGASKVCKSGTSKAGPTRAPELQSVPLPPKLEAELSKPFEFEEDGQIVHMEINVGKVAAAEFASEDEDQLTNENDNFRNGESDPSDSEPEESADEESQDDEPDKSSEEDPNDEDQKTDHEDDEMEVDANPVPIPPARLPKKAKRRSSVEARLDTMSSTLLAMKDILLQHGLLNQGEKQNKANSNKKARQDETGKEDLDVSVSETMIYRKALDKVETTEVLVDPEIAFKMREGRDLLDSPPEDKRQSSSSDEKIDTSDELMDIDADFNDQFLADCSDTNNQDNRRSRASVPQNEPRRPTHEERTMEQAMARIRESEAKKINMFRTPGNEIENSNMGSQGISATQHSAVVDENYVSIGSHIENSLKEKIKNGEYVDFARLLPRDRLAPEEPRLEIVNRGGQTFFVPVDRDSGGGITSFNKWEQAFRIFSNVYLKSNPSRATELIQYNHTIFTASNTYLWENVYQYDRDFRMHLSSFPSRSWAIILQQAWAMHLKDQIDSNNAGKQHIVVIKCEVPKILSVWGRGT